LRYPFSLLGLSTHNLNIFGKIYFYKKKYLKSFLY